MGWFSPGGAGPLVPCVCTQRRRAARLARECGLLPHEMQVNLDNLIPNGPGSAALLELAREYQRQPWGVWTIWGPPGNAKTMVLQALVNHFRGRGWPAVYIKFKELLDYVRAGNAADAPEDAVARLRRVVEVKLLAVDEWDKARATAYGDEITYSLIDDRWRYGVESAPGVQRHTVIAMNSDPAGLPEPMYDRLRDGRFRITYNPDPSMRPAMQRA